MRVLAALIAGSALMSCSADPAEHRVAETVPGPGPSATAAAPNRTADSAVPARRSGSESSAGKTSTQKISRATTTTPPQGGGAPKEAGGPVVSCLSDQTSDTTGDASPPGYADIVRSCVRSAGVGHTFETTVNGPIPSRMPRDDEHLNLGFALRSAAGETYVVAEGTSDGWTAYVTEGDGRRELSKAIAIDGSKLTITARLPDQGDASAMRWKAEASWLHSTLLKTSYAFDAAPSRGDTAFRSQG